MFFFFFSQWISQESQWQTMKPLRMAFGIYLHNFHSSILPSGFTSIHNLALNHRKNVWNPHFNMTFKHLQWQNYTTNRKPRSQSSVWSTLLNPNSLEKCYEIHSFPMSSFTNMYSLFVVKLSGSGSLQGFRY